MSTDHEWIRWGDRDPYFAVITLDKYRSINLDATARHEFFDSGAMHVDYVLATCRRVFDAHFTPRRVLDFGCGVGRVVAPFASHADVVVGVDVSPGMLREAQRNCAERGVTNVEWAISDAQLTGVSGSFDLVHSFIVFQHIDVERGRNFFSRLIDLLAPQGMAALHLTYAKAYHAGNYGRVPEPEVAPKARSSMLHALLGPVLPARQSPAPEPSEDVDPEMQMNPYPVNDLLFIMQSAGVRETHITFTDHGGELGLFLFFKKPPAEHG